MKALLLHSENSAVGKYRIWQPAKYLEKMGWEISRIPNASATIPIDHKKKGDQCWECRSKGADIIVMQRPDQPESIALALAMREKFHCPLVFEIDDDIYDVAESSTSYKYWYPGSPLRAMAEIFMKEADAITTTTSVLKDVYKDLNPDIYILPNYQDEDDWKNIKPMSHNNDKVIIGWQGSSTHYDDLRLIRRPLKKILRNYPNVEIHILGAKVDFMVGVERCKLSTDWVDVEKFPTYLNSLGFDIGIIPVVDRPFNRGKSNIKWQEYSLANIPTIASNVGEYKAIKHNVTGLLAYSESEWYFYLEQLIKDANLRKSLAKEAKQTVLANYTMSHNIHLWDETYRTIIDKYRNPQWQKSHSTEVTHLTS